MDLKKTIKYFLGMVLNAVVTLYLASLAGFPTWVVLMILIVLEGVPLLWLAGVIPTTLFIDKDAIGGFWVVTQSLLFALWVFWLPGILVKVASGFGIVGLGLLFVLVGVCLMIFRIRTMKSLLNGSGVKRRTMDG